MTKTNTPARPSPLTEVQQQVLRAALHQPGGAIAVPDRLKGKAAASVGQALIGKALVREIRTKADLPQWRQDADTGRRFSLVLTKAGRTLAMQGSAVAQSETAVARPIPGPAAVAASPTHPRSGSKLAEVIALLGRDGGVSVVELIAATGWLPHTTRAALTGLRKRGYPVTREAAEGGSVYRMTHASAVAA